MTKYHAIPTEVDGIRFDSKAEAARYRELCLLRAAGQIEELRVHPRYTIWKCKEEKIVYEADFAYFEDGGLVAEDVKGFMTPVYKLKRKMFLAMYPEIKFVEITK
jgi:hypothetical protein